MNSKNSETMEQINQRLIIKKYIIELLKISIITILLSVFFYLVAFLFLPFVLI